MKLMGFEPRIRHYLERYFVYHLILQALSVEL